MKARKLVGKLITIRSNFARKACVDQANEAYGTHQQLMSPVNVAQDPSTSSLFL